MSASMSVDAAEFLKSLDLLDKKTFAAVETGMAQACMSMWNDAVMQEPTAPLLVGNLRGSATVAINGKVIGGGPRRAPTGFATGIKAGEMIGEVIFNTEYAAHLHEHPEYQFTEPGSGGKWLEQKSVQNERKYLSIMVSVIKRMLFNA